MTTLDVIYRQALPGHIAALEAARSAIGSAAGAAATETIRRIAHSLRGSGGTYGYPQISDAAAAVEEAPEDALNRRLDHLLGQLRSVADGVEASDHAPRLLLVDDDPEIRMITALVLRAAGYNVFEAADSTSAGTQLAANSIDIVLMDVMLGAEDGIAVAERLLGARPGPPRLVFLTGATRADQLARMSASGACGVLHKPFDPERLPDALERALAGRG